VRARNVNGTASLGHVRFEWAEIIDRRWRCTGSILHTSAGNQRGSTSCSSRKAAPTGRTEYKVLEAHHAETLEPSTVIRRVDRPAALRGLRRPRSTMSTRRL